MQAIPLDLPSRAKGEGKLEHPLSREGVATKSRDAKEIGAQSRTAEVKSRTTRNLQHLRAACIENEVARYHAMLARERRRQRARQQFRVRGRQCINIFGGQHARLRTGREQAWGVSAGDERGLCVRVQQHQSLKQELNVQKRTRTLFQIQRAAVGTIALLAPF